MGTDSQKRILGGRSCAHQNRYLKFKNTSQLGSELETLWLSFWAMEDLTCRMLSSQRSTFHAFLSMSMDMWWNESYTTI